MYAAHTKFYELADRLAKKMKLSQVPVPGFLVGLSGTDSVIAFLMVYAAACDMGISHRVMGVHYVNQGQKKPSWFEREIIPWLQKRCPNATIIVDAPMGGNRDQQRWADLHVRALNEVLFGGNSVEPYEFGKNYWIVGTINATEHELGTYSILADTASLQPLRKVRKSMILKMCETLGVPAIAIENARLPDCLCGRDELAADNIDLVDAILDHNLTDDYDPDLVARLCHYIRDRKRENDWKSRKPYLL